MKGSIVAWWIATMAAWLVGVSVAGHGVLPITPEWALVLLPASSVLAWIVDGREHAGARASPCWFWLLYPVALASTVAWYVHAREVILHVELLLPTMAVLLVLMPARAGSIRRCPTALAFTGGAPQSCRVVAERSSSTCVSRHRGG